MLKSALEKFGAAWFPEQEESILPPKVVTALGLVAAVGITTGPKLAWLKANGETIKKRRAKPQQGNVVQMPASPAPPRPDDPLFRPL